VTPVRAALVALAAGLGLAATGALATPSPAAFDGAYAYELVKLQLSYGPRPAGSTAQRAVAERLVALLPGGHFEPVPGGLRNIVGELPGVRPQSSSPPTTTRPTSPAISARTTAPPASAP
jgi:hypothetical protein